MLFRSLPAGGAAAQSDYPVKAVRVIVGLAPGGGTDIQARMLSQKLSESMGRSFVVDNRTGAGGTVAYALVAKAPPDGYTLLVGSNGTNAINASLYANLPYDVLRDFAPVTQLASGYLLLVVHPSVPARTVRELIAVARSKPGLLSYGTAGSGTTPHLSAELFKTMAKLVYDWHRDGTMSKQIWGSVGGTAYRGANEEFANGQVVLYFSGNWQFPQFAKTIGDAFMAVSGLSSPLAVPALPCVRVGLEMIAAARIHAAGWQIRVGVNVGPVVAGIVGRMKYQFDVWGDTVNTAARVEQAGEPGTVCLPAEVWTAVSGDFEGQLRGRVPLKGKGEVELVLIRPPAG